MQASIFSTNTLSVLFLTILTIVLTSCQNKANNITLEPPENECQAESSSWQGIIPGQSTQKDVVEILGQPAQKMRLDGTNVFVYPPILKLASSYGNMIGFRKDGTVDWVDVWVLDHDGKFHTVTEVAYLYGTTLDRVYVNGSFDLFGPDQVYVWSECGVAITAVPEWTVRQSEDETLPIGESIKVNTSELDLRHPVPEQDSVQPNPDLDQIISRKFLFQPTSFDSFKTFYMDKLPYLDKQYYKMRLAK